MLTFDKTTLFYHTISANFKDQKPSGVIKNWIDTVAKAKTTGAAISNSCTSSTLQGSGLKPKSRAIKREGTILDIHEIGGLSDRMRLRVLSEKLHSRVRQRMVHEPQAR
jgi:hypothetical protein